MKVAVVGSRSLDDTHFPLLEKYIPPGVSEIISGGASGADKLAERFADEENLLLTIIRPDYKTYERMAPLIRNGEIVEKSDFTLILWDGSSRGSLNVIMTCIKINKPFRVILVR